MSAQVVGDGTTARSRASRRWSGARLPVLIALVVLLTAVGIPLLQGRTSSTPLAPDNPGPSGTRALAHVLGDQGVDVRYVRSSTEVADRAGPGTTLVVASSDGLTPGAVDTVLGTGADLVLLAPDAALLERATDGAVEPAGLEPTVGVARAAVCTDPDATAAGSLTSSGEGLRAPDVCFPFTGDQAAGAYAVHERADGVRVVIVDDATFTTNGAITSGGNAALALRVLGRHADAVWYLPVPEVTSIPGEPAPRGGVLSLLPRASGAVGLAALLTVVMAAWWRGRRLGPVVAEDLPVVVPAAEATRGRGRLYRRGRAHGHAGAALRAGAAERMAARLGITRAAQPGALVEAVARATGRPAPDVSGLLYGPPPQDDQQLLTLTAQLDQLESEVYRP